MVLVVLFTVIMSPVDVAFAWWTQPVWFKPTMILVDVCCWIDMVLTFFIATLRHGKLVVEWRQRAALYLRSWFFVDLLTNFPWDLILDYGNKRKLGKVMKLPKMLRMFRLLRTAREEAYYFGVFFSAFAIMLLSHYAACTWAGLVVECRGSLRIFTVEPDNLAECPKVMSAYLQGLQVGI